MGVVLLMAGVAVAWCALICRTSLWSGLVVAGFAFDCSVLAFQFKIGQVMIELSREPAFSGMTILADVAEPAIVWFILRMARLAIRWGALEKNLPRWTDLVMAVAARRLLVFTRECKYGCVVVVG